MTMADSFKNRLTGSMPQGDALLSPTLAKPRKLLTRLNQLAPVCISLFDYDTYQFNCGLEPLAVKQLGYTSEEFQKLRDEGFPNMFQSGDMEKLQAWHLKAAELEEGETYIMDFPFPARNGNLHWIQLEGTVFSRHKEGTPHELLAFFRDITSEKNHLSNLHAYEEQFRSLLNSVPDALAVWDVLGNCLYSNTLARDLFAESSGPQKGFTLRQCLKDFGPQEIELWQKRIQQVIETGTPLYLEDGYPFSSLTRWKEAHITPLTSTEGDIVGAITLFRDITQFKQTFRDLQFRDHALRMSINGVFLTTANGIVTYCNKSSQVLFGYSAEEIIGNHFSLFVENQSKAYEIQQEVLSCGTWIGELACRHKDGHILTIGLALSVVKDNEGQLLGLNLSFLDITERKEADRQLALYQNHLEQLVKERTRKLQDLTRDLQMQVQERERIEEALRKSEQHYRAIVETQAEMIARTNNKGEIVFVNNAFERMMNLPRESLMGVCLQSFIFKEDFQRVHERVTSLTPEKPRLQVTHRVKTGTGEVRWQEWTALAFFDKDGTFLELQCTGRDITDQIITRQMFQETHKDMMNFSQAKDYIAIFLSPEQILLDCNDFYLEFLGLTREQLMGKHLRDILEPELYEKRVKIIQKVINEKQIVTFEDINRNYYMRHMLVPIFANDQSVEKVAIFTKLLSPVTSK